jgi:hypothetical protein
VTVAAERMNIRISFGQQGAELFPDWLDDVWWDGGHELAPSFREASDTPRMIEHLCPFYTWLHSLLAEPLMRIAN